MTVPTDSNDTLAGAGRLIADRYRLDRKLGGGAMGTVWSGTDELLRRQVAIKEVKLPPGIPEEEAAELRERALREARAIAVLSHPNVVTLYDVARESGEPFVVMELVPSQSLATILSEHGALDDHQLAVIADGVAAGLEAAHRAGIVHRDVKPGNVLIGDDGRIKVSDFGISRNIAEHTITKTGILLGTPAFIAPEVAAGEAVSSAADRWGLGATMFAAAEGHPPYDVGDDPLATVTEVVRGPVPVASRPGPIGDIIRALMVKDSTQRMSLTDVRRRIQHLLPEPGARPFAMLLDPDAPTVKVRQRELPTPVRQPSLAPGSAPLARDPGLPPFALKEPPPRRRSRWAEVALGVVAVVLFAAALAGGFASTRLLAGKSVLPDSTTSNVEPGAQVARLNLAKHRDDAMHTSAPDGGEFSIMAPADPGWRLFHSERTDVANSLVVSFVSPDGSTEIAVQRYGGFFGSGKEISDYVNALPKIAAGEVTVQASFADGDGQQRMEYTTTEKPLLGSLGGQRRRSTAAELIRRGNDLWIVRVTVPIDQAASGEGILNQIKGTLETRS
ncbi:serine/threonine-protein kinase [Saccharopolyspora phatthalungensis]|uniref:non-specific serine/threonine protein kinase n=1 Tax=Saccharopolyspora phatthalungensis TaxID=664693 RepID=A0A840Q3J3_9PSEU|nr:serine/threonine-protein kinase [Saccharopolyspora phatthalungensis]MBB5155066.1 serine/threonine protein kinase [Saccharopolyspora phatthalungensis]